MPATFAETIDGRRVGLFQLGVAGLLTLVMIFDGIDLQFAAFSAPLLMKLWHLTKPGFAPLLAAAMIGMAFGSVIGSWAGDRFGRRPVIVFSVGFFGLLTVICGRIESPTLFVVCRFLSGLGFGAAFPVAATLMSEWMPRRAAGRAISVMTIGIPLGGLVGALAASWLLPHFGWRDCFTGIGAACLVLSAVLLWRLPESVGFLMLRRRVREADALVARAFSAVRPLAPTGQIAEPAAAGSAALFDRANRRLNVGLWLAVLANSFATYAIGGWLTVILVDLHLPLAVALRGPATVGLCAIVGALAVGSIVLRFGSRSTMFTLAAFAVLSALVACVAVTSTSPFGGMFSILFACLGVGGFCAGGLQPAYYVLATGAYDTRTRSRGVGVAAMMGRIGAIFSSFVGAAVLAVGHASGFFFLIAGLGAVAAIGIAIINRHIPRAGGTVLPARDEKFGVVKAYQVWHRRPQVRPVLSRGRK